MTAELQLIEPSEITAGLTYSWLLDYPDYLPVDGNSINYYLLKEGSQIVISGADNGDGKHFFEISASISTNYEAGQYNFKVVAINGLNKREIKTGVMIVNPDYISNSSGYDTRTQNKKVLDAIQKNILGLASKAEKQYTINGKSLERFSLEDLMKAESKYKDLVRKEEEKNMIKSGLNSGKTIKVYFKGC